MDYNEYSDFQGVLNKLCALGKHDFDNLFWTEIKDEADVKEFDFHIQKITESQSWDRKLNQKKGAILENFAVFLFSRFRDVDVCKNKRPGDNETDIETTMSEKVSPPFISEIIGKKIICECKNKKTSPIDVGMVVKLGEILPTRGSKFGIFISIKGMGGTGWRFGEGKRKKIMYKSQTPLISFTVEELEVLREGYNFYTMIQQKYNALVDEVKDETSGILPEGDADFIVYTKQMVEHLYKCNIISDNEKSGMLNKISARYG